MPGDADVRSRPDPVREEPGCWYTAASSTGVPGARTRGAGRRVQEFGAVPESPGTRRKEPGAYRAAQYAR